MAASRARPCGYARKPLRMEIAGLFGSHRKVVVVLILWLDVPGPSHQDRMERVTQTTGCTPGSCDFLILVVGYECA
jgi:hypothetical protein